MRNYLPELLALPLLPWLIVQGRRTRRITPRLPEASGATRGIVGAGRPGEPLQVLAVGESPVAGVGVSTQDQAITACLAQTLAAGLDRPVAWQALGQNGATARDALRQLLPQIEPRRIDVALVAFGVNDSTAFRSVRQWRRDIDALLQALEARCAPRLLLLSGVPPIGSFPALPQPLRAVMGMKAAALDRVLASLAAARSDTLHVPLALNAHDAAMMAHDGYHPSAAGCAAWSVLLAEACQANWRSRSR